MLPHRRTIRYGERELKATNAEDSICSQGARWRLLDFGPSVLVQGFTPSLCDVAPSVRQRRGDGWRRHAQSCGVKAKVVSMDRYSDTAQSREDSRFCNARSGNSDSRICKVGTHYAYCFTPLMYDVPMVSPALLAVGNPGGNATAPAEEPSGSNGRGAAQPPGDQPGSPTWIAGPNHSLHAANRALRAYTPVCVYTITSLGLVQGRRALRGTPGSRVVHA